MAQLKDDVDFNTLDADRWEDLCFQVLHAHNPGVKTINGNGGDEGIDAYIGDFENPSTIYQFKFFRSGFGKSQKSQIKKSLLSALERRSGFKWVLVCNIDPTANAQRWFDAFRNKHDDVEIAFVFGSELKSWLFSVPKVRKEYFPNQQDLAEAMLAQSGHDPLGQIVANARAYNNIVVDDRFKATVASDGECETIVYTLKPGVREDVPLFKVRPLNDRGCEALGALRREGKPFKLTPEDIEVTPQLDFLDKLADCVSISAFSTPKANPSPLRFYSSDKRDESTALFVELKTVREGEEVFVRSNEAQGNSPILVELACPYELDLDDVAGKLNFNLKPRYKGLHVIAAHKGAKFLSQLMVSHRLGISEVDQDFDDATFSLLGDMDSTISWDKLEFLLGRIESVCSFFGCDPVIDDSIDDPEFVESLMRFSDQLLGADKDIDGTISFTFERYEEEHISKAVQRDKSAFIIDMTWGGNLFGVECNAIIRTVVEGRLTCEKVDNGLACTIKGKYKQFVAPLKQKSSD